MAAAICAALRPRGERVAAFKPVVTGLDEPRPGWPRDHELLARGAPAGAGRRGSARSGRRSRPTTPPSWRAPSVDPAELAAAARAAGEGADALVCEGVGGLLVPLTAAATSSATSRSTSACRSSSAARPGLGTINHTLLTLEAARPPVDVAARS